MAPATDFVLLTRSRRDDGPVARLLRERGLGVLAWPAAHAVLLGRRRDAEVAEAIAAADVVAFTSRRGVLATRALVGRTLGSLLRVRTIAAVGPSTARTLRLLGVEPALVGRKGAASLGPLILGATAPGASVLLLRGEAADDPPAGALRAAGRTVVDRRVYRMEEPAQAPVLPARPAAVACASPSAARRVLAARPDLREVPFVAIGDTTAGALRGLGAATIHVALSPSPEAMTEALLCVLSDAHAQERS